MSSAPVYGHSSVIPPQLGSSWPRPDLPTGLEILHSAAIADICDAVGGLYVLDPHIGHLGGLKRRIVGVATTVKCLPGDNLALFGALDRIGPGTVLVVDNRSSTISCCGGDQYLKEAISRGIEGIVVDGCWRDLAETNAMEVGVFGLGVNSYSSKKAHLGEIDVPVSCGGVIVTPGDLIIADIEGCLVIPRQYIDQVVRAVTDKSGPRDLGSGIRALKDSWLESFRGSDVS